MKSKWFEYKEAAVTLRKTGMSMTVIEKRLGIPRSTLSGWFKDITLTEKQRTRLMENSQDGWKKARESATHWHRTQKALRLQEAKKAAIETLDNISLDSATLDLAFAMLYFGEGAKNGTTSIANSDPKVLRFVLKVLALNYGITADKVKCELHLRADQDALILKHYWSNELKIPIRSFRKAYIDQRSAGRPTYDHYKGVCVLYCGGIAIQRKLIYLYKLFCEKIEQLDSGA